MASMLAASEVAAITIAALSVLQRIHEFLKQPRRNVSAACLLAQRISALEQPLRCLQDVCAARGDSQVVQSVATACLRVHSAVCDAENVIQDILVRQDGGRVKEKVQLLLGAARRREALEECHAELSEAQELLHAAMSMGIFYNTVLQQSSVDAIQHALFDMQQRDAVLRPKLVEALSELAQEVQAFGSELRSVGASQDLLLELVQGLMLAMASNNGKVDALMRAVQSAAGLKAQEVAEVNTMISTRVSKLVPVLEPAKLRLNDAQALGLSRGCSVQAGTYDGQEVTVKVFVPGAGNHGDLDTRVQREAYLTAAVARGAPYIVQQLGIVADKSSHRPLIGLVFRRYECTLAQLLRSQATSSQLDHGDRLDLALQIARAVRHMHQSEAPVVHGHLKPSDVFMERVGSSGRWCCAIGNFASASFCDFAAPSYGTESPDRTSGGGSSIPGGQDEQQQRNRASTGLAASSLPLDAWYLAPEVAAAPQHQRRYPCDIWSLGLMLTYLLTGSVQRIPLSLRPPAADTTAATTPPPPPSHEADSASASGTAPAPGTAEGTGGLAAARSGPWQPELSGIECEALRRLLACCCSIVEEHRPSAAQVVAELEAAAGVQGTSDAAPLDVHQGAPHAQEVTALLPPTYPTVADSSTRSLPPPLGAVPETSVATSLPPVSQQHHHRASHSNAGVPDQYELATRTMTLDHAQQQLAHAQQAPGLLVSEHDQNLNRSLPTDQHQPAAGLLTSEQYQHASRSLQGQQHAGASYSVPPGPMYYPPGDLSGPSQAHQHQAAPRPDLYQDVGQAFTPMDQHQTTARSLVSAQYQHASRSLPVQSHRVSNMSLALDQHQHQHQPANNPLTAHHQQHEPVPHFLASGQYQMASRSLPAEQQPTSPRSRAADQHYAPWYAAPEQYVQPERYSGPEQHSGQERYSGPDRHTGSERYSGPEQYSGPERHTGTSQQYARPDQAAAASKSVLLDKYVELYPAPPDTLPQDLTSGGPPPPGIAHPGRSSMQVQDPYRGAPPALQPVARQHLRSLVGLQQSAQHAEQGRVQLQPDRHTVPRSYLDLQKGLAQPWGEAGSRSLYPDIVKAAPAVPQHNPYLAAPCKAVVPQGSQSSSSYMLPWGSTLQTLADALLSYHRPCLFDLQGQTLGGPLLADLCISVPGHTIANGALMMPPGRCLVVSAGGASVTNVLPVTLHNLLMKGQKLDTMPASLPRNHCTGLVQALGGLTCIRSCTISEAHAPGCALVFVATGGACELRDGTVLHGSANGSGLVVSGEGSRVSAIGTTIHANFDSNLRVAQGGTAELQHCRVAECHLGAGVWVEGEASRCRLVAVEISHTKAPAVAVLAGACVTLEKCRVLDSVVEGGLVVKGAGSSAYAYQSELARNRHSNVKVMCGGSVELVECDLFESRLQYGLEVQDANSRAKVVKCRVERNRRSNLLVLGGAAVELHQCSVSGSVEGWGVEMRGGASRFVAVDCVVEHNHKGCRSDALGAAPMSGARPDPTLAAPHQAAVQQPASRTREQLQEGLVQFLLQQQQQRREVRSSPGENQGQAPADEPSLARPQAKLLLEGKDFRSVVRLAKGSSAIGSGQASSASPAKQRGVEGRLFEAKLAEGKQVDGKLADSKWADGKLASGKLSEGKLSEGMLSEGKLASGKLSEGKLSEGKLAEGKLADGDVKAVKSKRGTKSGNARGNETSIWRAAIDAAADVVGNLLS